MAEWPLRYMCTAVSAQFQVQFIVESISKFMALAIRRLSAD